MLRGQNVQPFTRPDEDYGYWWRTMLIGLTLYAVGILILGLSRNIKLFPAVSLLGSFLMPVVFVIFLYEHRRLSSLSWATAGLTFFYGGILGVFAAALLEPIFIRRLTFVSAFEVGLVEEFAKILGVFLIAFGMRHTSEINGLILGAAAGMGFAALESNGYAFTAFVATQGNLGQTVFITLIRGLLSPLGHGTWTAILAAVLFRESTTRRFRIDLPVIGTFLLVAVLHGLWDGLTVVASHLEMPAVAVFVAEFLVGGIGLFILWRLWHQAVVRQMTWTVVSEKEEHIEE